MKQGIVIDRIQLNPFCDNGAIFVDELLFPPAIDNAKPLIWYSLLNLFGHQISYNQLITTNHEEQSLGYRVKT